jgi:UbiD family decarboxylase
MTEEELKTPGWRNEKGAMAYKNLREFLAKIESLGELRTVKGTHPETEIGCMTEMMGEQGGPALLSDEIQGFPPGKRVASNVFYSINRTAKVQSLRVWVVDC